MVSARAWHSLSPLRSGARGSPPGSGSETGRVPAAAGPPGSGCGCDVGGGGSESARHCPGHRRALSARPGPTGDGQRRARRSASATLSAEKWTVAGSATGAGGLRWMSGRSPVLATVMAFCWLAGCRRASLLIDREMVFNSRFSSGNFPLEVSCSHAPATVPVCIKLKRGRYSIICCLYAVYILLCTILLCIIPLRIILLFHIIYTLRERQSGILRLHGRCLCASLERR